VLGLEIDLGLRPEDGGPNGRRVPRQQQAGCVGEPTLEGCKANHNGCLDLNTGVAGCSRFIKRIYNRGSIDRKRTASGPFIPVQDRSGPRTVVKNRLRPTLAATREPPRYGETATVAGPFAVTHVFGANVKGPARYVIGLRDQLREGG